MYFQSVSELTTLQNPILLQKKRNHYRNRMFKRISNPGKYSTMEHIQILYHLSQGIDISCIPFDVFRIIMEFAQPTSGREIRRLRKSCRLMQHAITSIYSLEQGYRYVRWMRLKSGKFNLWNECPIRFPKEMYICSCNDSSGWMTKIEGVNTLIVDSTSNTIYSLYTYLAEIKHRIKRLILQTHCSFDGILDEPHRCVSTQIVRGKKVYIVDVQGDDLLSLTYPSKRWYRQLYNNP